MADLFIRMKLKIMSDQQPKISDFHTEIFPTWCPGCGDFGIWGALKNALVSLGWQPWEFVLVFGIGCSGNMADFFRAHGFHALHGRGIPVANAIKLANHKLPVIVVAGDGDTYGEGVGHLIASMRGNHDIKVFVHDNQVYGLTTGQSSPTTNKGTKTKSTPEGVIEFGLNPISLAISQGATFIARSFAGEIPYTTEIMKQALLHKGFALLDIFQPCVTFNRINTYDWFRERVYKLDAEAYRPDNRVTAYQRSLETDRLPIGVFFKEEKPAYHEQVSTLADMPLVEQSIAEINLSRAMQEFL